MIFLHPVWGFRLSIYFRWSQRKKDFAIFATVQSMAYESENGSEKKMAEGGNDAELLKEKANKYFKGRIYVLVKLMAFNMC